MAEPFATVSDLEVRWRPLVGAEPARAEALLGDASAFLRDELKAIDDKIEDGDLDPQVPLAIVCAMVKRAMVGGTGGAGITQASQTMGPFAQQQTFANPTGDLYLTKAERRRLGLGRQRAFSVDLIPAPTET